MKRKIQLIIDSNVYIRAKSEAGARDLSYSQFIENLIREGLERIEKEIENENK